MSNEREYRVTGKVFMSYECDCQTCPEGNTHYSPLIEVDQSFFATDEDDAIQQAEYFVMETNPEYCNFDEWHDGPEVVRA